MAQLRIGLIGLGGVAQAHLQAYKGLHSIDIVSVCDVQTEIADRVAAQVDANAYYNPQALLDAGGIDLVMVLTPASTHRAVVEAVAAAGVNVFCEKPLAVTLDDGEAIVKACKRAGVKFFYGSCYRYLPAVKKAYELIREGVIGEVQLMLEQAVGGHGIDHYRELAPIHYPLGGPGGPGMGLVDHGVHLIDIFSWFADAELVSVVGKGQVSGSPAGSEYLAMQFANGAQGHLVYNAATFSAVMPNEGMFSGGQAWLANGTLGQAGLWEPQPGSISVHGTKGALRIFHYANGLYINTGDGMQQMRVDGRPAFGHFATQLEDCAAAIFDDREPSVGGEVGVKALRALLEIY